MPSGLQVPGTAGNAINRADYIDSAKFAILEEIFKVKMLTSDFYANLGTTEKLKGGVFEQWKVNVSSDTQWLLNYGNDNNYSPLDTNDYSAETAFHDQWQDSVIPEGTTDLFDQYSNYPIQVVNYYTVERTMDRVGGVLWWDERTMAGMDNFASNIVKNSITDQAAYVKETYYRSKLLNEGTNYGNTIVISESAPAAGIAAFEEALNVVTRDMNNRKIQKFTQPILPSTKFNAGTARAGYMAIVHTDMEYLLSDNMSNILTRENYPQGEALPTEFGAYKNVRFCTDSILFKGGTGSYSVTDTFTDFGDMTFNVIVLGKDCFKIGDPEGLDGKFQLIWNNPQQSSHTPLGMIGSAGYLGYISAIVDKPEGVWVIPVTIEA